MAPGERPFGYAHSLDITGQRATIESPSGVAQPVFVFRMRVRASMRQIDHTALVVIGSTRIFTAPYSECTCESGIDCSHEALLVRCLYLMQSVDSYETYRAKVLSFDPARAPSGRAVWWADKFRRGVGGRQTPKAKRTRALSVDEQMLEGYAGGDDDEEVCA